MSLETAEKIFALLKETQHKRLKQDLLEAAIKYANIRAQWAVIPREERAEMSRTRTIAHDAFIDSCNILSRNMQKSGENGAWRNLLGNDRIVIGDFACYIHCILGISAG
ncbi:MAG: DUF3232 domain-containing protein [Ignavibacteria bacterium]|jgi:hypothetical protein|nr:DUF3232 domain-containing protein [Ignavibacteria bacterium]MCU7504266.1 DUF3232 domain-containing protein [Ignavibacteria bacterium]MCU7516111.1 DUF3232 domain-containing protein [Ignavibacteria bacterium]